MASEIEQEETLDEASPEQIGHAGFDSRYARFVRRDAYGRGELQWTEKALMGFDFVPLVPVTIDVMSSWLSCSNYPEAATPNLEAGYWLQNNTYGTRRICDICKNYIPIFPNGRHWGQGDLYWGMWYCFSHVLDGTPRCCSCCRLLRLGDQIFGLDGRNLCAGCFSSAIRVSNEFQLLHHNVRQFFERLEIKVEPDIPVSLVTRKVIDDATGNHDKIDIRGACFFKPRTLKITGSQVLGGIDGDRMNPLKTNPEILTTLEMPARILILVGLPRLHTGMILAHEMMHAWLKPNGYVGLRKDVEEGICQVLAFMWLESELREVPSRARVTGYTPELATDKTLGEFYKYQISFDTSPDYGGGFRQGGHAVRKYGLHATLSHVWATGVFPF